MPEKPEQPQSSAPQQPRLAYRKPRLQRYGALAEITQNVQVQKGNSDSAKTSNKTR